MTAMPKLREPTLTLVEPMTALDPSTALHEIYDSHATAVTRRLHRLCGDPELARDLCQDAFVIALGKLDELEDPQALGAWLHGIAYNLLRDHRRGRQRQRGLLQRWFGRSRGRAAQDPDREPMPALPAQGAGDEAQLLRHLEDALRGLDDDKRDAFVLRQVEGLSLADAAQLLGVSVQTVSYRAKQAEVHLRAAFEPT